MPIRKFFLFIIGFMLASGASGVDIQPKAAKAEDFVPKGWKLHIAEHGDLNQDGEKDVALVIQQTDKKKIIRNDGYGADELDTNPRVLLIAFKRGNAYELVLKREKMPSQNDAEMPCLDDPLELEITAKNTLKISLRYWLSCGSWTTHRNTYTFRYQNKRFELIGFDSFSIQRNTLNSTSTSINYSTGKELTVTGTGDPNIEPVRKWSRFKPAPLADLQTMKSLD
jgi:hypothetical protein